MTTDNVTILFTDIVDSTALSSRVSPSEADEIRRAHFAGLREAIAQTGGTEVKGLGDGVMVVFSAPSAALACAVAMQQRNERDNRDRDVPVGLRVGMSGGEVTREPDDYFGDPVVEASRLCARCEPGQILAAAVVPLAAGRRNEHRTRPLGPLELRGLEGAVETVEVLWEPAVETSAVPLPRRLTVAPGVGVLGRAAELDTIAQAFERVRSGQGREIVLISGEPGQGKTTLAAEAARAAAAAGATVLFGHSEEDLATPYRLMAEALGHYVAHIGEARLRAHVALHGSELDRMVPELGRRLHDLPPSRASDADTERYLLFAAVVGLLQSESEPLPIVLVLDDLQWADTGSLALLRHLAAQDLRRTLVVGTYRESEVGQSDPLRETLGSLHRQQSVQRMELHGLASADVLAFMEAAAGHGMEQDGIDLARAVHHETDGNPFFVTELLRSLSETGAIYQQADGKWVVEQSPDRMELPDTVREVIDARVARLGADAARVLTTASVIGRDFDVPVLAVAARMSEDALLDVLEAAARVALVRESEDGAGYRFAHALIGQSLYEQMGPNRQARAHRAVGEALEAVCGDDIGPRAGELARHFAAATGGKLSDRPRAVTYARLAGDAALAALAPADALAHYQQALTLLADTYQRDPRAVIDVTIGLGTAQRQSGDAAYRQTLLDAAHRAAAIGDTERLVAAALANHRGFYSSIGAIDADRVEVLEMALAQLPADRPERALVLATLCSELAHGSPLARRRALADEAVALAKASDDDSVVVRVLNHLHISLQVPSLLAESLERTGEALERAQRLGDPALVAWSSQWRAEAAARALDVAETDRCIGIHREMTERLGQPLFRWTHLFLRGLRSHINGDVELAEQLANEAVEVGVEAGQADAMVIYGAQLMIACGQRGTMSTLIPMIERMNAETPDIAAGLFGSLLAKAHVEADRYDEARRLLGEFADQGYDLPQDQTWLTGMVDYAEAAIECGDASFAGPLYERLTPFSGQLPATGASALCPVDTYLGALCGLLGRHDEAERHFAAAADFASRAGARFFGARTDLWWGQMVARRAADGDAARAHELLTRAAATAEASGYGNIARRAAALLAGSAGSAE